MKKTNDVADEVAQPERRNNKCYVSTFRYIYIYIYIYIQNMLANPRKSLQFVKKNLEQKFLYLYKKGMIFFLVY